MTDLIIVGAGGFAREIYELLITPSNRAMTDTGQKALFNVIGCLDDNPHALDGKGTDLKIIGTIRDFEVRPEHRFVMGIANPQTKEKLATQLLERGAVFADVIHPWVHLCTGCSYGRGFVAYPGATLGPDSHVGDFVTLLATGLGHDAVVGDYSTISSYCGINGNVTLGKRVFVGGHAVILPGVKVRDDAYVGMGSVVVSHVRAGTKVFGNPAHRMDF